MSSYGQTISIKHFLNKKVKALVRETPEESPFGTSGPAHSYPLYVRITVKRQATEIKSVLDEYINEDSFNEYPQYYAKVIQKESDLIREYVLRSNPFKQDRFSLKQTLSRFQFENQPLDKLINYYLLYELKLSLLELAEEASLSRLKFREPQYYFGGMEEIYGDDYHKLAPKPEELALLDIDVINWNKAVAGNLAAWWKDAPGTAIYNLYHSYPVEFWSFKQYDNQISGGIDRFYTLKDWLEGNYQSKFLEAWKDHPYPIKLLEAITTGFKVLTQRHLDLQDLINRNYLYPVKQ